MDSDSPIDFFISYSPADERWATWIAWQLEAAGHRTLLQAWSFVPGTNFIDFMDRGVRDSAVVVAVLSRNYLKSHYGRMEWQAALRTDHTKLVTIRIDDCPLEGLLATITYLDLVGITDPDMAREQLLTRLRHALEGRAKPAREPMFPAHQGTLIEISPPGAEKTSQHHPETGHAPTPPQPPEPLRSRRIPQTPPSYPRASPAVTASRETIALLHVPGPRFGRGIADHLTARDLQSRIWANVTQLTDAGAPAPDLILVTGDLMESGRPRERDDALTFLTGLRVLLGLEPDRLLIVPGSHDVSRDACHGYFLQCAARDIQPQRPYFLKLEHYAQLFDELYQGLDGPLFDTAQPWTLFAVPGLRVAIAGLNSTMSVTHRPEDDYGWIGEEQAAWFAKRLRPLEESGWLRVGIIRHDPDPGGGSAGSDPALLLRDTGTLDRLLGPRLNMLLHGPGPGGTSIGFLGSGLPVVPATGPGQEEIIQVTVDGLRRFSAYGDGAGREPALLRHEWHAIGGTFPTTTAETLDAVDGEPVPERLAPTPTADPQSLLLDRIEEVCETRYEHVKIRRIEADPPHLLVTHREEGFNPQWRVGAHVGEPSREVLEAFLRHEPGLGSELVYQGPAPAQRLREEALRRGVRLRSFLEFQGLLDLSGYLGRQTTRLRTDPRYPPTLYVPQRFRELHRSDQTIRDDLAEELVRLVTSDYARFVLLLGDFGRGKTFALYEVARRIAETTPHLIPMLIELRELDKAHSVHGLVAAHLANHGEELIDLKAFHYMLREGRIVLLFDGFDELVTRITYDRATEHLETLLEAVQDRAKIVVASRTQHFKSDTQVFTALGERVGALSNRWIFSVEDFTQTQIRGYLVKCYGDDQRKADTRLNMIKNIQDLLGLSQNPRMLSFIADLSEDRLRAAADARHTISAAGLYREILESWLSYEATRAASRPGTAVTLRLDDLWQAVTTLALHLWESGEPYLRLAQLTEVAQALSGLAESRLSPDQTAHAMGRGSLLVRTEEGLFGFIHSSVAEWLVANRIARQLNSGTLAPPELQRRALSKLTTDFLCDLADTRACQAWADSVLTNADANEMARTNALKVSTRLRTPPTADLRGASLKGEDLSYRELQEVDLTDADLTGARLVGADLRHAILRHARLVGARLDEAQLTGADLTGADLRRARLSRADLSGATVAGSRWTRAALIDTTGIPDASELHGAAVAPGSPVETEFSPASIGVRHGFDAAMGRLPRVLDYSRDGDMLAIGNDDGGVLICDTTTGQPLRTLQGHRGRVFSVTYGEDILVTGSTDSTVRIWDAATGRCRHVLTGHKQWSWPVVISPSGAEVATGDADGVLRLWDIASGSLRREFPGSRGLIFSLAFSGQLVAVAHRDGSVRCWDASTGVLHGELTSEAGPVYRVAFNPFGDILAAGGQDGSLRLWDPSTCRPLLPLQGHTGRVYTLAFHPSEPLLVSGDTDGGVRVWNTTTGRLHHALSGHDAAIYWVTFSPSGDLVATGDSAGAVHLWDSATGRLRHALVGHTGSVWPFVFRRDGAQLAISDDQFTTRLWDPATGQCRHTLTGHGRQVTSVRFSADSSMLAASGNDGVVRLWDPTTGRQLRRLPGTDDRLVMLQTAIFSPSGHRLVTVSNDGRLNLLNLDTDRYERHLDVVSAPIWAVAFSPSGEELATANDDDTVRLWYRATGRLVHTLAEHRGRVRSIAFSADGALIATGCDDSAIRLWDAESGKLIRTMRGHSDRVYAVDFGDGMLASASWDRTARVWDVQSGELLHELKQHTQRLWTAAFSPSGNLLATAGDDLVVRLWDPQSGRNLHTLTGHTRSVWSVTFSPSGDLLATGGDDGTTRLWSVTNDEPVARLTLLGLPEGWAALAPDGRYKLEGNVGGQFWNVINMCRFETGELDSYLPEVRQLALETPFLSENTP
ncbi:MAG: TIR domain-containing protein [Pseudonocardiales bacterium]|nr:TIR domain-containing protein [Pseudonocardiales bacterium]